MNWHTWEAAFFVTPALVGCALGVTRQGQAPYAHLSQKAKRDMHDDGDGGM